jgi:hypothetical protein
MMHDDDCDIIVGYICVIIAPITGYRTGACLYKVHTKLSMIVYKRFYFTCFFFKKKVEVISSAFSLMTKGISTSLTDVADADAFA